jgi:hypothetical protein
MTRVPALTRDDAPADGRSRYGANGVDGPLPRRAATAS